MTKKVKVSTPVSRAELEERFKKLWESFDDSESGSTSSFGIEAAAANPCGTPPIFAIQQANEYLLKNPHILTRYSYTRGFKFIRQELVETVGSMLESCCNDKDVYGKLSEDNISLAPGINSSINLITRHLRNKSKQDHPNKTPCIVTNEFFYSIPDILDVRYISANSGLIIHDGISAQDINDALEQARNLNMNPIIYYNVTPDNPTGTITSQSRSFEQQSVFMQPENRSIYVLNDLAYHMTYLEENQTTHPICSREIKSVILHGLSKIAAPGARISFMVSEKKFLHELEIPSFSDYMFPSIHSQLILYFFFLKKNEHLRIEYLNKKRKILCFNEKLMLILVEGLHKHKDLDCSMIESIYEALEQNGGVVKYKHLLEEGISGISVINKPKAAFFHIFDFSTFRGKSYQGKVIEDGVDLAEIFHSISNTLLFPLDLLSLGNSKSMLKETSLLMRVTYSMSTKDIIDFVLCVEKVSNQMRE